LRISWRSEPAPFSPRPTQELTPASAAARGHVPPKRSGRGKFPIAATASPRTPRCPNVTKSPASHGVTGLLPSGKPLSKPAGVVPSATQSAFARPCSGHGSSSIRASLPSERFPFPAPSSPAQQFSLHAVRRNPRPQCFIPQYDAVAPLRVPRLTAGTQRTKEQLRCEVSRSSIWFCGARSSIQFDPAFVAALRL
jgi:hypothetical protein